MRRRKSQIETLAARTIRNSFDYRGTASCLVPNSLFDEASADAQDGWLSPREQNLSWFRCGTRYLIGAASEFRLWQGSPTGRFVPRPISAECADPGQCEASAQNGYRTFSLPRFSEFLPVQWFPFFQTATCTRMSALKLQSSGEIQAGEIGSRKPSPQSQ